MLPILDVDVAVQGLDRVREASPVLSGGQILGLAAIIFGCLLVFGLPIVLVSMGLRERARRRREISDLILKLAEKGQPVPPELFLEEGAPQKSDLRRGVILASVGLGLIGFGAVMDVTPMMAIGFIPMMMGVGFALSAWLERKQRL